MSNDTMTNEAIKAMLKTMTDYELLNYYIGESPNLDKVKELIERGVKPDIRSLTCSKINISFSKDINSEIAGLTFNNIPDGSFSILDMSTIEIDGKEYLLNCPLDITIASLMGKHIKCKKPTIDNINKCMVLNSYWYPVNVTNESPMGNEYTEFIKKVYTMFKELHDDNNDQTLDKWVNEDYLKHGGNKRITIDMVITYLLKEGMFTANEETFKNALKYRYFNTIFFLLTSDKYDFTISQELFEILLKGYKSELPVYRNHYDYKSISLLSIPNKILSLFTDNNCEITEELSKLIDNNGFVDDTNPGALDVLYNSDYRPSLKLLIRSIQIKKIIVDPTFYGYDWEQDADDLIRAMMSINFFPISWCKNIPRVGMKLYGIILGDIPISYNLYDGSDEDLKKSRDMHVLTVDEFEKLIEDIEINYSHLFMLCYMQPLVFHHYVTTRNIRLPWVYNLTEDIKADEDYTDEYGNTYKRGNVVQASPCLELVYEGHNKSLESEENSKKNSKHPKLEKLEKEEVMKLIDTQFMIDDYYDRMFEPVQSWNTDNDIVIEMDTS